MRIANTTHLQIDTHYHKQIREEEHERLLVGHSRGALRPEQMTDGMLYERHRIAEVQQGSRLSAQLSSGGETTDAVRALARQAPGLAARALTPPTLATALAPPAQAARMQPAASDAAPAKNEDRDALEVALLIAVIEKLSGRKLGLEAIKPLEIGQAATASLEAPTAPGALSAESASQAAPAPEFGLSYDYHYSYSESELSEFRISSDVLTQDGRRIALDMAFSMSRSFSASESISLRLGAALKDPLVLSFSGTASLARDRFQFDLDADGQAEQINRLGDNSAFLALDLDGSGRIESGRELFGALSGDGFADLAQYDQDSNGFIDEGDAVFKQLRLWQRDAQGVDSLRSLQDMGVGALALARAETPFDLTLGAQLAGKVRSSGFYLTENGSGGALQQIDLVT